MIEHSARLWAQAAFLIAAFTAFTSASAPAAIAQTSGRVGGASTPNAPAPAPSAQTPSDRGGAPVSTTADASPQPGPDPAVASPPRWVLQAQSTFVDQGTARFTSPCRGPNSLDPGMRGRETFDASLWGGLRLWKGADVWIEPEVDQGFGLSNTLGVAGFFSGEAYKVGAVDPYIRLQRLFVRQSFDLGGEVQKVDPAQMVFAGAQTSNHLVFWAGKMSVGDVFDTNKYAHDPRGDFFNWSIIDAGSFDYAADAWGYTYGLAGEWYQGDWATRLGLYDMSKVPNGERPDDHFTQFQIIAEEERDFSLFKQAGKLKLTAYVSRARMGDFAEAIQYGQSTDTTPNVLAVRRYRTHAGLSLNLEQQVTGDLGLFVRGGYADGHQQSYEFTDVDRTLSAGLSLSGKRWRRPDDTVGIAGVGNEISHDFRAYLNAGGLGILVGDGRLPHPGPEQILETYYSLAATPYAHVTFDYQFVENPAYNRDRGPVSAVAIRLHLQSDSLLH